MQGHISKSSESRLDNERGEFSKGFGCEIMTITLQLKPETQRKLEIVARENDLPVGAYLEEFIEESMADAQLPENAREVDDETRKREWSKRFHAWLDSHKDRGGPFLSDEALRRENIYED